jgi:hypothetical protein
VNRQVAVREGGVALPAASPAGRQALSDIVVGSGIGALATFFLVGALQTPFATARWTWFNAPGFVPAVIAGVLLLQALLLVIRGLRRLRVSGPAWVGMRAEMARWGAGRFVLTLLFALAFVILMGRVSFGALTGVWLFAMILVFRGTTPLKAALVAAVTAVTITWVFTHVFLVPLP